MTVLALAGGSWIFLGVVVMLFFVLVFSYFTVAGSGINLHPWEDQDGSSHGANGSGNAAGRDEASDVRNWTRGTR